MYPWSSLIYLVFIAQVGFCSDQNPVKVIQNTNIAITSKGDMLFKETPAQHPEVYQFKIVDSKGKVLGHGCIAYNIQPPIQRGSTTRFTECNGIKWSYIIRHHKLSCVGNITSDPQKSTPAISIFLTDGVYVKQPQLLFNILTGRAVE